ncbi:uncharacterized protein LOC113231099 isoform X1 [Hyposmocoma kahamanoa]|uniref:uncharacterized protein LOC113231099 isoform X1 n=1 Tax=Hyposmocoma kahamanoa TaxID=1477025 RepID=UPI000E6D6E3F|nr:uncharacterized protein LOC113231099 isoform X1 [Hyposmocoma kahamanoa]
MNVIGIFVFGLSAISVAVCMTTPPPVSISWPWGDWKPTGSTPTTIRVPESRPWWDWNANGSIPENTTVIEDGRRSIATTESELTWESTHELHKFRDPDYVSSSTKYNATNFYERAMCKKSQAEKILNATLSSIDAALISDIRMFDKMRNIKIDEAKQVADAEKKRLEKILWHVIQNIKAECDNGDKE